MLRQVSSHIPHVSHLIFHTDHVISHIFAMYHRNVVLFQSHVQGSANYNKIKETVATESEVSIAAVELQISAASVNAVAIVTVPSTSTTSSITSALSSSFSSAEAASTLLGDGITVEIEPLVVVAAPPSSPPRDEGIGNGLVIGIASGGGALVLVVVVALVCIVNKKRGRQQ